MMNPSRLLAATLLTLFGIASSPAQTLNQTFETLKGTCAIAISTSSDQFEFRIEHGTCRHTTTESEDHGDGTPHTETTSCHSTEMQQPFNAFSGFVQSDLGRDGAHVDAILIAEAGTLTCSGTIHNFKLSGDLTFTPNAAFAARLLKLGIQGITSQNLETYTLFRVQAAHVEALQKAGVADIDAKNLASLSIFHVDPTFVEGIRTLGYPTPSAKKLVELKIHKVDPAEVRQVRAMGYNPTLDELIQMRIFKVTPAFITDMRKRGFGTTPQDLTIAKLVKIRIFKLAE